MLVAVSLVLVVGILWIVCRYDNGHGGFRRLPVVPRAPVSRAEGTLDTVYFPARDGTRLEAWLFTPRTSHAPLVVMAPGLTGTKDCHLEPFAWRFVAHGLAVLLIDYRGFGGSDGEPRHWVDPSRHAEDYEAALAFARGILATAEVVDAERIALWGSSFSGGTVLALAASHPELRAVVAQCPFVATPREQEPSAAAMARYVAWTMIDLLRARLVRLGLPVRPLYIPVFGRPDERAFARSAQNPALGGEPGSLFWRTLPDPPRGGWENKMLARVLAGIDAFEPMKRLGDVRCPVYLVAGKHDDMLPVTLIEAARARLLHSDSSLTSHPCRHFDLYVGEWFEPNVTSQAEFLERQLRGVAARSALA